VIPYRVFLSLRVMRLFFKRKDGAERLPPFLDSAADAAADAATGATIDGVTDATFDT